MAHQPRKRRSARLWTSGQFELLPARNRRDLDDIPEDARAQLRFVWLERVDDALDAALAPVGPASARAAQAPTADAPAAAGTSAPAG